MTATQGRLTVWFEDAATWYFVCPACRRELAAANPTGAGQGNPSWQARAAHDLEQHVWADGRCQLCEIAWGTEA